MKQVRWLKRHPSGYFEEGQICEVFMDGANTYIYDRSRDRFYFNLIKDTFGWYKSENVGLYTGVNALIEEVKEPTMQTSKEEQVKIYRKMAENIEQGLPILKSIQVNIGKWRQLTSQIFEFSAQQYRVKPDTITLPNGLEVPKPLGNEFQELSRDIILYSPLACKVGFSQNSVGHLCRVYFPKGTLIYTTKEEAQEASRILFGLEIKDV